MEDSSLKLTDHLLLRVFHCCGLDWRFKYQFSSRNSQEVFDMHFGKAVVHTLCASYVRTMSMARQLPILSTLTKETFYTMAQLLEANDAFNSAHTRFLLMVHVAMIAVFFIKSGKSEAGRWAFDIIHRYVVQVDFKNQVYYSM